MDFEFAEEDEIDLSKNYEKWRILIADDDKDVHLVTKLALKNFSYENKEIEFYDAYNGNEAVNILKENPYIDLILLDVIMDSNDDGLTTVKRIRNELKNSSVRIVLRTGQPGRSPERDVILNYAIDDYKEKTELTSTKLLTTVVTSLRASSHIKTIERSRAGLIKIIEASRSIYELDSLVAFTDGVLTQLSNLLDLPFSNLYAYSLDDSFIALNNESKISFVSSKGKYRDFSSQNQLSPDTIEQLKNVCDSKKNFYGNDKFIGYLESKNSTVFLLYVEGCSKLNDLDRELVHIFYKNIEVAFRKLMEY